MVLEGMQDPVLSSQMALEKLGKLTPVKILSAIYRRIFPASSLMQYWWIAGARIITATAVEDAQSYNRLIAEWMLYRR